MQRFAILGSCLIIIIVAFATKGFSNEERFEMHVPMGILTLKAPLSVESKKSNVKFPHSRHFVGISCQTCHHNWNGSSSIKGCMTSGCHNSKKTTLETGSSNKMINNNLTIPLYKKAYHSQCIGCHKSLKEKIKKIELSMVNLDSKIPNSGPTGCVECHPK